MEATVDNFVRPALDAVAHQHNTAADAIVGPSSSACADAGGIAAAQESKAEAPGIKRKPAG